MKQDISLRTACLWTVLASYAAFLGGKAASVALLGGLAEDATAVPPAMHVSTPTKIASSSADVDRVSQELKFPAPELIKGKEAPKTNYASMVHTDVLSTTARYATLHLLDSETESALHVAGKGGSKEVCYQTADGHSKCSIDSFSKQDHENDDQMMQTQDQAADGVDEKHLPAGQHLLVDIERVNSSFLDDEVQLAQAMVDVVNETQITLLSYHCHKLIPMGVSCVGVLLESHISFHTWPEAGVITLDLFTCGSGLLVPVLPIIKKLFALPREGASDAIDEQPHTVWTHKLRGFRDENEATDLMTNVLESSVYDLKEEIVSVQTPFQHIHIVDIIFSEGHKYDNYEKSLLKNSNTYQNQHPELFQPDRLVFLDEVLQSRRVGNAAYHEALVQPAMFLHPNPRKVAIIGGGEGATLREVLKHNTVEKVKMMDIDEVMVNVSRQFLPDWNSCIDFDVHSDGTSGAEWCGDDERADVDCVDAFEWFDNNFPDEDEENQQAEEKFDLLIMDALDPEDDVPFAETLYKNQAFIKNLYHSLTDDGIIVFQLGESTTFRSPAEQFTSSNRRKQFVEMLEDLFPTMHFYEEANCGFYGPWTFLVVTKEEEEDARWFMSEAAMDVEIHKRTLSTVSGEPILKYFDSSVMKGYHYPHKASQSAFCRAVPMPDSCIELERRPDVPASNFEVRMSSIGDGSGRGVFTNVDIKKGSRIGRRSNSELVHVPFESMNLIYRYMAKHAAIESASTFIIGYGWEAYVSGGVGFFVESSIFTFVNHGCDATYNVVHYPYDEEAKGFKVVSEESATISDLYDFHSAGPSDIYSLRNPEVLRMYARTDIKAGSELFSNYVIYAASEDDWTEYVAELRNICNGNEIGEITLAERAKANDQ